MCLVSLFTLRHMRKRRNYSRENLDWEGSQKASIQLHKGQKPSWWKSEELIFSAGLQIKVMQLIPKKTVECEKSYKRSRVGLTAHLQVQIWDDFIWSWESFTLCLGWKLWIRSGNSAERRHVCYLWEWHRTLMLTFNEDTARHENLLPEIYPLWNQV